jgi:hypothetical protein
MMINNTRKGMAACLTGVALGALCAGCSGTLYTANNAAFEDGKVKGIIFYPPALYKEMSQTTVAIKDGKVIGTAGDPQNPCRPVPSVKLISAPDYSQPHRVWYEHGLLETFTFSTTLDAAGDLLSVNTQSTPDQGKTFQNIASGISSIAPLAAGAAPMMTPACTDGAVAVSRTKYNPE